MFFVKTRENQTQGFEIILKIDQNKAFCAIFKEIFENFLKNCPHNWGFRPKGESLTQGFLIFLKKSPKRIHFLQFAWEIFGNFSKFSDVRGAPPPRTPYEADPLKCSLPRTEILAEQLHISNFLIFTKIAIDYLHIFHL